MLELLRQRGRRENLENMTVFEGAEETLETLRNNLVGFQWTETRRVKIEFRMRQNQSVREGGKMGIWMYPRPAPHERDLGRGGGCQWRSSCAKLFPISLLGPISGLEL